MNNPVMRFPPHTLVPHDAELVLASDYDTLAARLTETRAVAFQDVLDSIQDRQVKDHVARCLQDKFGVWWKASETVDAAADSAR